MTDCRQILSHNIKRLRAARGLSQEALAWEAGLSRGHMNEIEAGRASARVDTLCKLAKALGCEPAELLKAPPKRRRSAIGG
jgi:transcriptional regulator with XRE-family HTH domain